VSTRHLRRLPVLRRQSLTSHRGCPSGPGGIRSAGDWRGGERWGSALGQDGQEAIASNLQALSEEEAQRLHRTCGGRVQLTTEAASVLLAIIDHVGHEIWIINELFGPHRDGASSLDQQGLLVHRHGSVEPDEDVIFSLRMRSWGYDIVCDPKA
jgi:hypothetical protein